eukprot:TRINITY_DN9289_c0_g1_i1.p1 TRINITY_DN9289_c0_g1~~TRINITY_DN9289_c0_g1_i1.p1  ORF type:complete len:1157 (+),score=296.64 TRINITY_DN9289_c0_g1_i1:211-3681(+)
MLSRLAPCPLLLRRLGASFLLAALTLVAEAQDIAFDDSAVVMPGYTLWWKVDVAAKEITVKMKAATAGWVGFGIAHMGGMKGADMVVGFVDDNGVASVKDYWSLDNVRPSEDECQDWQLVSGGRTCDAGNCTTTIVAKRALSTADAQDWPILDDGRPTRIVVAYGRANSFSYHSSDRRSTRVLFFPKRSSVLKDADFEALRKDPNVGSFELRSKNFEIPVPGGVDPATTYVVRCFSSKDLIQQGIPDSDIIGIEPIIDPANMEYVHHFIVTGFFAGGSDCRAMGESMIWGWAPGVDGFMLEDDIGFPLGSQTGAFVAIGMQVHYNNPSLVKGVVDSSGIRVYYTTKRRKIRAGVLEIGDPDVRLLGEEIPGGLSEYRFSCTGEFTEKLGGPVTVQRRQLHMHGTGTRMTVRQLDKDGNLKRSSEADIYDYNFQDMLRADTGQSFQVNPGDSFDVSCYFKTPSTGKKYSFGLASQDEMCIDFVYYYPAPEDPSALNNGKCSLGEEHMALSAGPIVPPTVPNGITVDADAVGQAFIGRKFGTPCSQLRETAESMLSGGSCKLKTSPTMELPDMRHETVKVSGDISLQVTLAGSRAASAKKLLFVHGFPEARMTLAPLAAEVLQRFALRSQDMTAILVDQRGFNASSKPTAEKAYELPQLVADMAQVLEQLLGTGEKATVVSHDWGGPVSWALAAERPDLVEALVAVNAPHPDILVQLLKTNAEQQAASDYILEWTLQKGRRLSSRPLSKAASESLRQSEALLTLSAGRKEEQKRHLQRSDDDDDDDDGGCRDLDPSELAGNSCHQIQAALSVACDADLGKLLPTNDDVKGLQFSDICPVTCGVCTPGEGQGAIGSMEDVAKYMSFNKGWNVQEEMGFLTSWWWSWELEAPHRLAWKTDALHAGLRWYADNINLTTAGDWSTLSVPWTKSYDNIQVPTQVIWGMKDVAFANEDHLKLFPNYATATPDIVRMADSDHWLILSEACKVAEHIDKFLTSKLNVVEMQTITGSLTFSATGVSKSQVESSVTAALSQKLGVDKTAVTLTVTETRRLGAARRLAGSWQVDYTVNAPASSRENMKVVQAELAGDPSAFGTLLKAELVKAGAEEASLGFQLEAAVMEVPEAKTTSGADGSESVSGSKPASLVLPLVATLAIALRLAA